MGGGSKRNAKKIQRAERLNLRFNTYDFRVIIENKDELYQDVIWNELRQPSCHSSSVLWLIFRARRGKFSASPVLGGTPPSSQLSKAQLTRGAERSRGVEI